MKRLISFFNIMRTRKIKRNIFYETRRRRGHVEKTRAKRTRAKRTRAKRTHAKRTHAKRTHAKRTHAKKTRAKKTRAKKTRARRTRAKKTRAKRTRAKKTRAKKTRAKKTRARGNCNGSQDGYNVSCKKSKSNSTEEILKKLSSMENKIFTNWGDTEKHIETMNGRKSRGSLKKNTSRQITKTRKLQNERENHILMINKLKTVIRDKNPHQSVADIVSAFYGNSKTSSSKR